MQKRQRPCKTYAVFKFSNDINRSCGFKINWIIEFNLAGIFERETNIYERAFNGF